MKIEDIYFCFIQDGKVKDSVNDKPAIVFNDGTRMWYKNNSLHRDTKDNDFLLPAVVKTNGDRSWYRNGKLCRGKAIKYLETPSNEILPQAEFGNGSKEWFSDKGTINDLLYRESATLKEWFQTTSIGPILVKCVKKN